MNQPLREKAVGGFTDGFATARRLLIKDEPLTWDEKETLIQLLFRLEDYYTTTWDLICDLGTVGDEEEIPGHGSVTKVSPPSLVGSLRALQATLAESKRLAGELDELRNQRGKRSLKLVQG